MEVGVQSGLPTYSGGLGVLAGDTLRAAADMGLPMVGVTLLHRQGYFRQHLDARGSQSEAPAPWNPETVAEPMPARATVTLEGRPVQIRAWRYKIVGCDGYELPIYFLDTNLPENSPWDRTLTDFLYGGDQHYRLCQEVVLGMGGVAMLGALGFDIATYHLNEGHSALLALELLSELNNVDKLTHLTEEKHQAIRRRCVFTTHTPVPAGLDQFPHDLACRVLGEHIAQLLKEAGCCFGETLNMTHLALYFSHYVNGVAMRHGEISRSMFPGYPINSITNGVHAATWTAAPFQKLFDQHIPEWRRDNNYLRYAICLTAEDVIRTHAECKRQLLAEVERRSGFRLDPLALTLGFARRATAYKRADLIFTDLERLRRIAQRVGPLQIIFAGKAHARDEGGKAMIHRVFQAAESLRGTIPVVYLEEYDMDLARLICSGVDLWLNTPHKPEEASGTSGMKAAMNGVPSLSILDGWWLEGCVEGTTGWAIGSDGGTPSEPAREAESLYGKLEFTIAPFFYQRALAFGEVMRNAIAINGSFYNAQRMVSQYVSNAYRSGSSALLDQQRAAVG
jgi:starch phosphorylase